MANLQLVCDGTAGLNANFSVFAEDSTGARFAATGTASIDDYASAYVAQLGIGNNGFQVIPKIKMNPGDATKTVTATFALIDSASGAALPPATLSVDLVAPPPPGQKATQTVITTPAIGTGSDLPDPGNASISVSLN